MKEASNLGKKIDRLARTALGIVGLYLLFLWAYGNIPVAIVCTLVCGLLLRRVLRGTKARWARGKIASARRAKKNARAQLDRWSRMEENAAAAQMEALIRRAYPAAFHQDAQFCAILRHPDGTPIAVDDVLGAYRKAVGKARLILASTAASDPRARALAKTLRAPETAILEGGQLLNLLVRFAPETRDGDEEIPPRPARARPRLARLIRRDHTPRRLLYGAALLAMYFLLGNTLYLLCALAVLLFAGLGLRAPEEPAKLF